MTIATFKLNAVLRRTETENTIDFRLLFQSATGSPGFTAGHLVILYRGFFYKRSIRPYTTGLIGGKGRQAKFRQKKSPT